MFWMAGMAAVGAVAGGLKDQADAEIAKLTEESNTLANNKMRKANNKLAGARGTLSRFLQSRSNQVHLQNAGAAVDSFTTNIARFQEASTTGSLERRLQVAEEAGAFAARQGASGMGGGTMQMLSKTTALRQARGEQQIARTEKQQLFDAEQQKRAAVDSMILGLDNTQIIDDVNLAAYQARDIHVPSSGEIAGRAAMAFMQAYAQYGGGGGGGGSPASAGTYGQTGIAVNTSGFRAGVGSGR